MRALATAAYGERSLPAGTPGDTRLAIPADALEEIGCTSPELLEHLHRGGGQVPGCWALDLALGRG